MLSPPWGGRTAPGSLLLLHLIFLIMREGGVREWTGGEGGALGEMGDRSRGGIHDEAEMEKLSAVIREEEGEGCSTHGHRADGGAGTV